MNTPDWLGEHLFLENSCRSVDELNLVAPIDGPDRDPYVEKRPTIYLRTTGETAALPLSGNFGLHFAATGLHDLYQGGKLAIVHGIGFPLDLISRSHFDAQDYCDLGTPGNTHTASGWLARHLASAGQVPDDAQIPALAAGSSPPNSLLGRPDSMTLDDPASFHPNSNGGSVNGEPTYKRSTMITLDQLYAGGGELEQAGAGAATTVELVDSLDLANYTPSPGANYPSTGTGATLSKQAQIIANVAKHGAGLQVATLDFGGWYTHENESASDQGNLNSNQYAAHVDGLSQVLTALYNDLAGDGLADRMIVVVQSEFGRRVIESTALSRQLQSLLRLSWLAALCTAPSALQNRQLFQNEDVATTIDTRRILSEIVTQHLGNNDLASVFPGYSYPGPLGVLPGDSIFANGFD